MFGFIDHLYAARKRREGYVEPVIDWHPRTRSHDWSKSYWFCFVPSFVCRSQWMYERLVPKVGTVVVYPMGSKRLIAPDPADTSSQLMEMYADAIGRVRKLDRTEGTELNVLGISLGNVLSIRLANEADMPVNEVVSIVGGGRLGMSAWDSLLTSHVAKKSGLRSAEEYEEKLATLSPVNNLSCLRAHRIRMRLGQRDLLIRYKHGLELAEALENQARRTSTPFELKSYLGMDHGGTMIVSALSKMF